MKHLSHFYLFSAKQNRNENKLPPKSSGLKTASSGVHPAAIAVPLLLLLLGGATAAGIVYYFRGRLWPHKAERMQEDKQIAPPGDNFDNPLYGQNPAISVISNESQS